MDKKIKNYQKAILDILNTYAKIQFSNVKGENQVIADKENNRFLIMTIGWQKNHFVHDCPMHFDIIDGKIWVQTNMTEWNVAEMLEQHGIDKKDIVLGFLSPSTRAYSDYAEA
jgi:acetylornithine/succinyldiaminopimelate/putrescine aminotransferase